MITIKLIRDLINQALSEGKNFKNGIPEIEHIYDDNFQWVKENAINTDMRLTELENKETLHVYSTDEKIVGKWVDGKFLYEKSYIVTNGFTLNSNSFNNIVPCDLDIDKLVFHSIADPSLSLNLTLAIFSNGYIQGASAWPGNLNINPNSVLTIQYTKTTDTSTN